MNIWDLKLIKKSKLRLRKSTDPSKENFLYSPGFQGTKAQLRQSRTRALKMNLRFFKALIPPQRFGGGMGVQRDVEDRSLPRPVGETGRRSVGNRKERQNAATVRVSRVIVSHLIALRRSNKKTTGYFRSFGVG